MKLALTPLLLAALAALLLAAVTIDTAKFAQATGVRLGCGAKVTIEEGQTLSARVVNVAVLARLGLKGAGSGEVVQVTLLSVKDRKLKLMHVPSGSEVTMNYDDAIVSYG
jgi:hypothetical protein